MMSIVFLLLVLLISLGVSVYMNSVSSLKEGLDDDSTEAEGEVPPVTEGEVPPVTEGEVPPVTEGEVPPVTEGEVPPVTEGEVPPVTDESKPAAATGEESTFDVSPMEGSCTETMTNYN
jgi:hypothetical protein